MSRLIMKAENIWECPGCKQFYLVGKRCQMCNTSYADVLTARNAKEKKERKKPRKPYISESISGSGLLESFMKRKKENG